MAKPFEMRWGSREQDSLGAQIKECEEANFSVENMNPEEFAETFGDTNPPENQEQ